MKLENTYLTLSNKLYSVINPNKMSGEILLYNKKLAEQLNLPKEFVLNGHNVLIGNSDSLGPLFSQAYSGHQYGNYTTLGDGRAVILGEVLTEDNIRYDIQLKGSGKTPYSRRGDGKATLYSMLREYLISEAMYYLDVETTRSLAVIKTDEKIQRITMEQGGILARVAESHIRVGTFEFASANGGKILVQELADYTINRHFSNISDSADKYQLFLKEVINRQAKLIAKWQSIGFIHGVMNTDNMLISGETIDYGPCAFMDYFDPKTVFSSIDSYGRYAYKNQPYIASWNLSRFAETLLPLFSDDLEKAVDIANQELQKFGEQYLNNYNKLMAKKIGFDFTNEKTSELVTELLLIMEKYSADFTNTFVSLTKSTFDQLPFYESEEWKLWFQKWTRELGYRQMDVESRVSMMMSVNPIVIPRNHLVEKALDSGKEEDLTLFNELLEVYKNPYNYFYSLKDEYKLPGKKDGNYKTYCGT